MGNILNDIVEDVEIKPNKSKKVIKWIISIALSLIGIAFTFGQFKSTFFNRMDTFEKTLNQQTLAIETLKKQVNTGFESVDAKINKVYTDGFKAFNDYQQFNKEQLLLVLDYGQDNKDLLKRMLELNSKENAKIIENQLEIAKNKIEGNIIAIPIKSKIPDYITIDSIINNNDTTFYVIGGTLDFINNIDRTKYDISEFVKNSKYADLYNVTYHNK